MLERKCAGCGKICNRETLIKITAQNPHGEIVINGGPKTFGRSVYLCYNETCIEAAFKKNRIAKHLKTSVPSELKGQILNELRND
ncbi:YlxR family protein [bacterium]|nr:YlxR family protein [bacterium]